MLLKKELTEIRHHYEITQERANNKEDDFNTLQIETKALLSELQQSQVESLQRLDQQLATIQKSHEKDTGEWKTLVENQRIGFMVKLDEARTAKEKAEKATVKSETELQQQLFRHKDIEERYRALAADLSVSQQRQQEAEIQLSALKAESAHKDSVISFFKDLLKADHPKSEKKRQDEKP